jgi:RNA polymerase sigma-70 factor (ECF subfamily)
MTLNPFGRLPRKESGAVPFPDDQALVRSVVGDRDEKAFALLYDRHAPLVYGIALRMLGRSQEAEDVLQQVFLAFWERASSFDPSKGSPAAWLVVMARSRGLDALRRRRVRREGDGAAFSQDDGVDPLAGLPDPGAPVLDGLVTEERRAHVRRALASLPPPQRVVLEEAFFGGLTQEEIAAKLGEPLGTVKTRIRSGMMKLAGMLSPGEVRS